MESTCGRFSPTSRSPPPPSSGRSAAPMRSPCCCWSERTSPPSRQGRGQVAREVCGGWPLPTPPRCAWVGRPARRDWPARPGRGRPHRAVVRGRESRGFRD